MAGFSRLIKGLQTLFPASGLVHHAPSDLREEVNLVHPFPGRASSWDKVETTLFSTAANVTPSGTVLTATQEEWIEILYGDVHHDSATARAVALTVQSPVAVNDIVVWSKTGWTGEVTGAPAFRSAIFATASQGNVTNLMHRPFFIPPGFKVFVQGDTAAAAYVIDVAFHFVRHPFPEEPLF